MRIEINVYDPKAVLYDALDPMLVELTSRGKGNVRADRNLPEIFSLLLRIGRLMHQTGYVGGRDSLERACFRLAEAMKGHSYAKDGKIYRQEAIPDTNGAWLLYTAIMDALHFARELSHDWINEYREQWLKDEKEILESFNKASEDHF